jgi:membrane protein
MVIPIDRHVAVGSRSVKSQSAIERVWSRGWPVISALIAAFQRNPVPMLARQAAYSLLYALPAMIALLLSLASLLDRYTDAGLSTALQLEIEARAPDEFQEILDSIVDYVVAELSGTTAAIGAIVALVVTLWSGAGGTGALMYACNRAFNIADRRSWVFRKLLALAITLASGAMVIVAFLLVLVGERLQDWIAGRWGWSGSVIDYFVASPIGPTLLVFAAVALLYWVAPDLPHSGRWVLPGAILAAIATMLAFVAFDLLVGLIDPGSAFGAAGSVLVLLWLLDLVSLFVVSGAVINAALSDRYDARMIAYLHDHPERRIHPHA